MTSLDELIAKARLLLSEGHSPGQIADELSLSMETVTWLLTQKKGEAAPKDVHIDWTAVSSSALLLDDVARLMLHRYHCAEPPRTGERAGPPALENATIVGIAISGVPLATLIAQAERQRLAIYHPAKHSSAERPTGSISGNFSAITGERCIIVDDVITSGRTMHEVVDYLRRHKATPVAIWVLFDKRGIREVDGVPVYPVFRVSRID
ncbi:MAG TPA: orotate phosphoribosyltransferase-like protein [Methanoregulaceae archaeon]|nr:orotate phosphoribosyltransferase-like protein [Methanoregulaceae archaeon]HOV66911.1 orotate phosphoribosyltransferase-like protein [Methanoregulaceae archaeon]HQJ88281.1 orotate phosphoribosyltransferase-like protein [Methanoregulaceae archaeon]